MRNILFFIFFLILPFIGKAQEADYRPFIEEGKFCYVGRYPYGDCRMTPFSMTTYYFGGDTIVAGHTCKKWMKGGKLLAPIYEEGRRVYFFKQGDETPRVFYDFSIPEGGQAEVYLFGSDRTMTCYIDSIKKDNNGFRVFYLHDSEGLDYIEKERENIDFGDNSPEDIEQWLLEEITYIWVEGFGTWDRPEYNVGERGIGNLECLVRVTVGDEIIYDIPDAKWPTNGIKQTSNIECKISNATYDLSGRKMVNGKWLNGKLQKGIYIHDGKKVVRK